MIAEVPRKVTLDQALEKALEKLVTPPMMNLKPLGLWALAVRALMREQGCSMHRAVRAIVELGKEFVTRDRPKTEDALMSLIEERLIAHAKLHRQLALVREFERARRLASTARRDGDLAGYAAMVAVMAVIAAHEARAQTMVASTAALCETGRRSRS